MTLTRAIVRPPSSGFAGGITSANLGLPFLSLALEQHARYCTALVSAGLEIITLPADSSFPDSTFVEDTSVILPDLAIITRLGASSRRGEEVSVRAALARFFERVESITSPGTVDGGDICEADNRFYIGISERTNVEGAAQLERILARKGLESTRVDIRGIAGLLHLKSGLTHLGDGTLLVIDALSNHPAFHGVQLERVPPSEEYAANCVRINEHILLPAGFPEVAAIVRRHAPSTIALDVSEFRKMDGGLSCLSLRF